MWVLVISFLGTVIAYWVSCLPAVPQPRGLTADTGETAPIPCPEGLAPSLDSSSKTHFSPEAPARIDKVQSPQHSEAPALFHWSLDSLDLLL